jgi:hypothetical protein
MQASTKNAQKNIYNPNDHTFSTPRFICMKVLKPVWLIIRYILPDTSQDGELFWIDFPIKFG